MKRNSNSLVRVGARAPGRFKQDPPKRVRSVSEATVRELEKNLVQRAVQSAADFELKLAIQRAGQDAVALAWTTAHPLLFLPALLEEKIVATTVRHERQVNVRARSFAMMVPQG